METRIRKVLACAISVALSGCPAFGASYIACRTDAECPQPGYTCGPDDLCVARSGPDVSFSGCDGGGLFCAENDAGEGADGGSCQRNADCSGNTPVCDTATGRCVECITTADCANALKVCDTGNQCVYDLGDCGSDSDCSGASLTTTPVCDTTLGQCVGCTATDQSDCTSAGLVCNTITETCGTIAPVSCTSNSQCSGATPVCDTSTGFCVGCLANTDCPSGDLCVNGTCSSAIDSDGGEAHTDGGRMHNDGGTPRTDGGPNRSDAGSGTTCASDSDCVGNSAGTVCLPSSGMCGECSSNADCVNDSGRTCSAGACVASSSSCAGVEIQGGECTSAGDCASDPAGSQCSSPITGVCGCITNADCSVQKGTCDVSTGICTGGSLGCGDYNYCINVCAEYSPSSDRTSCECACGALLTSGAQAASNALDACIMSACPTETATCTGRAQESLGACYSRLMACLSTD